jgi:HAMP domain-containing protein
MKLSVKINVLVAVGLVLGLSVIYRIHSQQSQHQATQGLLRQAELLFATMESVRNHHQQQLLPLLEQPDQGFRPQLNPSWNTMQIMAGVQSDHPEVSYQVAIAEAALPLYQANIWQQQLIERMVAHPATTLITEQLQDASGHFLVYARPLVVNEAVIGAKTLRLNSQTSLDQVAQQNLNFAAILLLVFVLVMLMLNLLLHFMIIKPIGKLANQADLVSRGEADQLTVEQAGSAEVNHLSQSFSRLHRSLKAAMSLLSERA